MTSANPTRVLIALVAVIFVAQLLNKGLQQLRPPPPPVIFSAAANLTDARAPSLGPADADVVIMLFSDYACPLCRAMHPDLRKLVATDRRVRIVYRDWPILGPRSVRAARLAIAAQAQGRHAAFDDQLMRRGGPLDDASLQAAAIRAGVDWKRLEQDTMRLSAATDDLLGTSSSVARGAGFSGTPTLIVGPYLVEGRISYERLRALVAMARGQP